SEQAVGSGVRRPPADGTGQDIAAPAIEDRAYAERIQLANERTLRWLDRCVAYHKASGRDAVQSLFPIVQGGTDLDQRDWCVERIGQFDAPGYAIGGVAVGEGPGEIRRVVEHTAPKLPGDRPRYLMGVGYERDIVAAVRAGVDMFDCVLPTRNGRRGVAFTPTGPLRLKNAGFREDPRPLVAGCDCLACGGGMADGGWRIADGKGRGNRDPRDPDSLHPPSAIAYPPSGFSRAYLHHLFRAGEMLGPALVSLHNLRHFQRLLLDIRRAIRDNAWSFLARDWPVAFDAAP
ncbi:MAG: tRNA guanosine(34) transglycosylase Tgt, partial [Planctomycetota bacterium]